MKFKENFKRFFTLDRHHDAGFTLVELIVVIAILAILAGVAVPMYSGYIKKAEEASDLQLLGAVSTAFAAAAMEQNEVLSDLYGTTIQLENGYITGMTVVDATPDEDDANQPEQQTFAMRAAVVEHPIYTSFKRYYGNMDTPFKFYSKQLKFTEDGWEGDYVVKTKGGKHEISLSKSDAKSFFNSIFGSNGMKSEDLLDEVDEVVAFTAAMLENSGGLQALFASENYTKALAKTLGVQAEFGSDDFVIEYVTAMENWVKNIGMEQYGLSEDDVNSPDFADGLGQQINAQLMASNAVLYSAQNTDKAAGNIMSVLTSGNAATEIIGNLTGEKNDVGMAQASIAYGLYTAYVERYSPKDAATTPTDVLGALNDTGFQNYLATKEAASDLDGYLAAMNMINANANNDALVKDVLANGFGTDDLIALMNAAKAEGKN